MIRLRDVRLYAKRFPLRRPFRFGIVELTELEHLVVAATFVIDGQSFVGHAGENLVPRWFVKDASQSIEAEVATMRRAVRAVAETALRQPEAATPLDLWWQLHTETRGRGIAAPPLLAQLAESLIERAAIDAWCRCHKSTFAQLLLANQLGVSVGRIHNIGRNPAFGEPPSHLFVRHTVGLSDDLFELPEILREAGIHRLKIKLAGSGLADAQRVADIVRVCESDCWTIDRVTLDGNENYKALAEFVALTAALRGDARLRAAPEMIAWIEQPFHRDIALSDDVGDLLSQDRSPPMVIDESDASPADLPRALALGYAGTTHKNCKGVFKSILHRAVLSRHAATSGRRIIFSGEDLTIVAPWSQAFDLAVAAAVGVIDVERNGQHYANGLSGFGAAVSEQALKDHPQLYRRRDDGVVELNIVGGQVEVPTGMITPPSLDEFAEISE